MRQAQIGGASNPYTDAFVASCFEGFPAGLQWKDVVSAFTSAPDAPVRGGASSTLFLVGMENGTIRVASRMDGSASSSTPGRAACPCAARSGHAACRH